MIEENINLTPLSTARALTVDRFHLINCTFKKSLPIEHFNRANEKFYVPKLVAASLFIFLVFLGKFPLTLAA